MSGRIGNTVTINGRVTEKVSVKAGERVRLRLLNAALAASEVALTGYVRQHHALWAAGPLLAGVSAGSIVGSLLLGARGPGALGGEAGRRLPRLLACYALGLAEPANA